MRLHVRHVTRYEYEPPAQRADLRLKLYPSSFASQRVVRWSVSVNGKAVPPLFVNAYGDGEAVWRSAQSEAAIEIVAEGVVETDDASGVLRGHREMTRPGMFLRATPLTASSAALAALAEACRGATPIETLHKLCDRVRDVIVYEADATHAATTAAEALKHGKGVCQDHAHVFIACARALGVPARYVAGYVEAGLVGAQQSHAWAEAHVPDLGWIGFDPSNRQCPTDAYIRLGSGLDADDAAPLRGWVSASVRERLAVEVDVAPSQAQSQTQQ